MLDKAALIESLSPPSLDFAAAPSAAVIGAGIALRVSLSLRLSLPVWNFSCPGRLFCLLASKVGGGGGVQEAGSTMGNTGVAMNEYEKSPVLAKFLRHEQLA